ncbi:MAG: mechanosensitive ion channel family protein [Tenuifilaceae bacterium]|nr:mechanosensitive ion channel family protein [Tenuifilaceae bacterium]
MDLPELMRAFNFDLSFNHNLLAMEWTANIMQQKVLLYPLIIISTTLVCFALIKLIRGLMSRSLRKASVILRVDPTKYTFLKNTVSVIIISIGVIVVFQLIPELRKLGMPLFAGAGVLTAVVGFASQQALSNIVGGVFIVMFRPFRVGDLIKIGTMHTGTVEDITLRHTVIRDFENRRIIVPNAIMNNEVVENSHINDETVCVRFEVNIAYSADTDKALDILQRVAEEHPLTIDVRTKSEKDQGQPKVRVRVVDLTDSAVVIRAWIWTATPDDSFALRFDMFKAIKSRFRDEGIEIPFPQRVVYIRKEQG